MTRERELRSSSLVSKKPRPIRHDEYKGICSMSIKDSLRNPCLEFSAWWARYTLLYEKITFKAPVELLSEDKSFKIEPQSMDAELIAWPSQLAVSCTRTWAAVLGCMCPLNGCTWRVGTCPIRTHSPYLCFPLPSVYAFPFLPGKKIGTEIAVFPLQGRQGPSSWEKRGERSLAHQPLKHRGCAVCPPTGPPRAAALPKGVDGIWIL